MWKYKSVAFMLIGSALLADVIAINNFTLASEQFCKGIIPKMKKGVKNMTLEEQVKVSRLKQKFKLKNAELQYLEQKRYSLDAQSSVLTLELEEIKIELILLEQEQKAEHEQMNNVDPVSTFDTSSYLDLDLQLNQEIKSNSGEVTLDFTQATPMVTDTPKDSTGAILENIENYLNDN